MNKVYRVFIFAASLFLGEFSLAQPAGCTPTPYPDCPSALTLVPGAACVTGTTCDGGAQAGSSCLYAGSECSWYEFTATATDMFVNIDVTATDGCHISSNVYEATGACVGTEISCLSGAPLSDLHSLTGLTIGNDYYVQVCYSPGGPCGNGGAADYCISVGEPDPPCDVCATPCGTATGYPTNPAVQTVVDDCQTSPFVPELQPSTAHTFCYNFTATASSVDFNVIITSNCGGGNVTNFSWELYNATCGAPIQTGTLASLTFSPVTIGNDYVFCYTFTVPSTCTHSQHCPYFVGATVPLPVEFVSFDAEIVSEGVQLEWLTASEINCDHYLIEKSFDGQHFTVIGEVEGNGNTTEENSYSFLDRSSIDKVVYYRIKQVDTDGKSVYTGVLSVNPEAQRNELIVQPNPVNGDAKVIFSSISKGIGYMEITDVLGNKMKSQELNVSKGVNEIDLETSGLKDGIYVVKVQVEGDYYHTKFLKN